MGLIDLERYEVYVICGLVLASLGGTWYRALSDGDGSEHIALIERESQVATFGVEGEDGAQDDAQEGGQDGAQEGAALDLATPAVPSDPAGAAGLQHGETHSGLDINTATAEQLEALPGIGPTLAGRIVEYRRTNGPFESVEELDEVKGIGKATLEKIRPYVIVGH